LSTSSEKIKVASFNFPPYSIGSYQYAKETTDLIKQLVYTKLEKGEVGVKDLWKLLCEFRKRLITSKPLEFSISNIVKRVISIIRDEAKRLNLKIDDEIVEEENKESKVIDYSLTLS
jgi:translation initiation factor 2B subunit (eIF-2B alpha/beta/delta family)